MVGVLHILSQVLGAFALALLVPAAIGIFGGEEAAARSCLIAAGLVGFFSGAVYFGLQGRSRTLNRVSGFVLVIAVWTLPPLIAAAALSAPMGADYVTALFEATSGYTTTGATVLAAPESIGRAGVIFRAELQWLGGLMTLLTLVIILAPAQLGGMSAGDVAAISVSDQRFSRVWAAVRQVLVTYGAVTIACIVLLFATGVEPFVAICLALSTVSTGGFMPAAGELSSHVGPGGRLVLAVFMLIGATSIVWHRMIAAGRWQLVRRQKEGLVVIAAAIALGIAYAGAMSSGTGAMLSAGGFGNGLFMGISLVSTTGFEAEAGHFFALPATIVLIAALIGGGTMSTAGGIKYRRIGVMIGQSVGELRRMIYPHAVAASRLSRTSHDLDVMKGLWSHLAVCAVVVLGAALLLGLGLRSYHAALTASVAAFANIGPLYSAGAPVQWLAYGEFDTVAKLVMIVTMVLGRIEVLVLVGALNLAYWRS